jgi:hypothetical protein
MLECWLQERVLEPSVRISRRVGCPEPHLHLSHPLHVQTRAEVVVGRSIGLRREQPEAEQPPCDAANVHRFKSVAGLLVVLCACKGLLDE